jgi:uncharacterized protein
MTPGEHAVLEPQVLRYDEASGSVTLLASECTRCGRAFFPPRRRCAACAEETLRHKQLGTQGQIGSFTTLHRTPRDAWVTAPYVIAEVLLADGVIIYGHILGSDGDDLQIGMPVRLVPFPLRGPHGEEVVAYGFRPVSKDEGELA